MAAFNAAVADEAVPDQGDDAPLATRDGSFSVAHVVTGGPDGTTGTTLVVADGHVAMRSGAEPDATVTVALSWDDAVALSTGALSPTDALAAGRIRVRGDLGALVAGQALLAALHPRLADLHAATTY